jgi:hypothetical protein
LFELNFQEIQFLLHEHTKTDILTMEQHCFPSLLRFVAVTNEFDGYSEEDAFCFVLIFMFCFIWGKVSLI